MKKEVDFGVLVLIFCGLFTVSACGNINTKQDVALQNSTAGNISQNIGSIEGGAKTDVKVDITIPAEVGKALGLKSGVTEAIQPTAKALGQVQSAMTNTSEGSPGKKDLQKCETLLRADKVCVVKVQ